MQRAPEHANWWFLPVFWLRALLLTHVLTKMAQEPLFACFWAPRELLNSSFMWRPGVLQELCNERQSMLIGGFY